MSVKWFKNENGFSLPEITIAVGLLAGISLVTMKILDNQVTNESRLKTNTEIQKTVSLLKTILNNPRSCSELLAGQPLSPTLNGVTNVIKPAAVTAPGSTAGLYQKITASNGSVSYKEILAIDSDYGRFRIGPAGSIQFVKVTNSGTGADAIDLVIRFGLETQGIIFRDDGNSNNDKIQIQRIPLMVTFNSANEITDCGLVTSDINTAAKKKLCLSLGNLAKWNDLLDKCEFNSYMCTGNQVPARQNDSGTLFTCVDIHEQFNVQDLFVTGTSACAPPNLTGKFRIEAEGTPPKLAIKCHP